VLGRWLGERGIGMAVSIASMCNAVYMLSMLQRRFAPIGWSGMRTFAWRLGGISVLAATGFVVGARLASLTAAPEQIARFLAVAVPGLLGFAVFLAGVFAFRLFDAQLIAPVAGTVTEADEAQSPVTTRFRGCCG
jgi:peptidoglycan biosynthesis protein MviN/MurJ (putative lipid II flippase)